MSRLIPLRAVAWIAACALLLGALAPSISRVMAHADGEAGWIEVCTMAGIQRIAVGDASSPAEGGGGPAGLMADDCPYCSVHLATALPPPHAGAALVVPAAGGAALPRLFLHAPRPLFAWAASHPRAPPPSA